MTYSHLFEALSCIPAPLQKMNLRKKKSGLSVLRYYNFQIISPCQKLKDI